MACGEYGPGRMAEPLAIVAAIEAALGEGPLAGRHVIVTSGPTHEPIDPVRYIANRSSGAQGAALAAALRDLGARVTFVTGPADGAAARRGGGGPGRDRGARCWRRCEAALPADAAVMAAAVADWRVANAAGSKMKKDGSGTRAGAASSPRTPTSWPPSPSWPTGGRGWWWALPPRPTTSWRMPPPSGCARAATGSWPMTCARRPGSWAGPRTR